jgi:hypothetical protein
LKVDTRVERCRRFSGPEHLAVTQLMKEVFHDDTATPFGKERFTWDEVKLPGRWSVATLSCVAEYL